MDIAKLLVLSVKVSRRSLQVFLFFLLVIYNLLGIAFLRDAANLPGVEFAPLSSSADEVKVSYGIVTAPSFAVSSAAAGILRIGGNEKGFLSQFALEVSKHRCYEREMDGLTSKVAF